jgi:ferredoxin
LDEVFLGGAHIDRSYQRRRQPAFVIVAECTTPAATCFCSSMNSGPQADHGFDLALIELGTISAANREREEPSRYLLRVGSERGGILLEAIPALRLATPSELDERSTLLEHAAATMGRALDTSGLRELLARNIEHPQWKEVAERCLSCGNCTMVCPSCFCTDVNDVTDLRGGIERQRHWASCFDLQHSYLHGGAVRSSSSSRYRQWAVHKLSTWHDQFGTSGCVGCGRCITWCPVGIDITEEVAGIRATDGLTQADLGTRAVEP